MKSDGNKPPVALASPGFWPKAGEPSQSSMRPLGQAPQIHVSNLGKHWEPQATPAKA